MYQSRGNVFQQYVDEILFHRAKTNAQNFQDQSPLMQQCINKKKTLKMIFIKKKVRNRYKNKVKYIIVNNNEYQISYWNSIDQ